MRDSWFASVLLLALALSACDTDPTALTEIEPFRKGPYSVGSTNLEVAPEYADIGDEAMHDILLGRPGETGNPRFIADILKHPESAWITDVPIPDEPAVYGPASGLDLPVVTFVAYPAREPVRKESYRFPYHDGMYGVFENMLGPGETPVFASPGERYPLIILAHGWSAHAMYEVEHAYSLASHGYIVAAITYGDERTFDPGEAESPHIPFLRPLLTRAVLDSLLESETFGPQIDTDNIGISGHSFGGFTALASMGGPYKANAASVRDERIRAAVVAAPWVGHNEGGKDVFAFGPDNQELSRVVDPVICLFGTKDEATPASFILPAMQHLSGPTYVVELVGQPHIFEPGSWEDRNNWELLFFSAYLKKDPASLEKLRTGRSMKGGNEDAQLFDYQRPTGRHSPD